MPVVPGAELPDPTDAKAVVAAAERVGYPLLVKAARGGGGKGIRRVERKEDLAEAVRRAASEAKTSFGSEVVYLERYVERPAARRDPGDRRRPRPRASPSASASAPSSAATRRSSRRRRRCAVSDDAAPTHGGRRRRRREAVGYRNAGTVEFLVGADRSFYFMEMNNRLQVEHPITELRYGVDLVREQLRVAQGLPALVRRTARRAAGPRDRGAASARRTRRTASSRRRAA